MTRSHAAWGLAWPLILVLGIGTFVMRLSFIQLYAWLGEFPPPLERALGFIPVAVLAALVFPELLSMDEPFVDARSIAGALAAVTAWRTGNMMATILVGMGVLWGVRFVFG